MNLLRAARAALPALATLLAAARLGAQVAPDARWRTFDTEHFQVHYTEGLEDFARRAAARAEEARAELDTALVPGPRGRVHLVLADNVDYANGFASLFPRARVIVYAHPPADETSLAFADDWLQLVVSHELTHIHHLDHATGVIRLGRRVLGRNPAFFPNATAPRWITEGLATNSESRLTGEGRVEGTYHDMVLRTAVLEDAFFPIDRLTADPVRWPGGSAAYVYGSLFEDWLSDRYGPHAAEAFVRVMGRRVIPYRLDAAARAAYGISFTRAYTEWRNELRARYSALADSLRADGLTEPQLVTEEGRQTEHPRWSPDGARVAYASSTGRDEPSTRVVDADGTVRVLAARTTVGPLAWLPDGSGVVTAQLDLVDPYRTFSDLYRVGMDGSVRRLTRGARLLEPDVRRQDGRIVAVRGAGATNELVVADSDGSDVRPLVPSDADVRWSMPRWSPDGTRLAAGRWRTGGLYDVVVMDADGGGIRELTHDRALDLQPTWSPDGRYVVFSSDRTGIPNLYAYDLASDRLLQATNLLTGGFQPDVSPDGRWIAFSWHRADGFHVARIPFAPETWRPAPPPAARFSAPETDPARFATGTGGPSRPYSPWRTLAPTAWTPTFVGGTELGDGFGATVGGSDVIERHAWGLAVTAYPEDGIADASAGYIYSGLGVPVLGASAFQDWDRIPLADSGAVLERERSAALVATIPFPRYRSYTWVSTGVSLRERAYSRPDGDDRPVPVTERGGDLGAVLTVGRSSARAFDFSLSQEKGWLVAGTVEGRRYLRDREGLPRGYARVAGRAMGFTPVDLGGYSRHVLGARVLAAGDVGARSPGFAVGGLGATSVAAPLATGTGIGSTLEFPLRGYDDAVQIGDRAVAGSVEYRLPLLLVERGLRVLPLSLGKTWGTVFGDAGAAWCLDECPTALYPTREFRPLVSVGAEVGASFTFFYYAPIDAVVGVGVPLRDEKWMVDGEEIRETAQPQVYFRLGRLF